MPLETTAALPSLTREGDVFLLDMGESENRFNPESMDAIEGALAEVAKTPAPRALVTTASGKFWSNGLDLDWLAANQDRIQQAVDQLHRMLASVLGADVPTVAAIQGHAFAAGAMFAAAHDQCVMREDRGYWCVPEVDLRLPFTPGMTALLKTRLSPRAAHEAMVTGRRYGATEAVGAGIIDEAVPEQDVRPRAIARAAALAGKDPATLEKIKTRLYAETLALLREPQSL